MQLFDPRKRFASHTPRSANSTSPVYVREPRYPIAVEAGLNAADIRNATPKADRECADTACFRAIRAYPQRFSL